MAEEETIGIIHECLTYDYRDATADWDTLGYWAKRVRS